MLIFSRKGDCLGCAVLLCLVFCLTLLASFFLPSHLSFKNMYIIRDATLRALVEKGPSFREQNAINWKINEDICRRAVAEYKCKWSKKEVVDIRVLGSIK